MFGKHLIVVVADSIKNEVLKVTISRLFFTLNKIVYTEAQFWTGFEPLDLWIYKMNLDYFEFRTVHC